MTPDQAVKIIQDYIRDYDDRTFIHSLSSDRVIGALKRLFTTGKSSYGQFLERFQIIMIFTNEGECLPAFTYVVETKSMISKEIIEFHKVNATLRACEILVEEASHGMMKHLKGELLEGKIHE